jgi:CMP/dCMP kinase
MIISFMGVPGSGKSTVAKLLADKLNFPFYNNGSIWRQKAKERGLTAVEYGKLAEKDPTIDLEIDNYQTELGKIKDNFIIDGRTSWHFIPQSFKIYLDVNEEAGAKRVFNELKNGDHRNEDKNLNTVEDVLNSQQERHKIDNLRYKNYFNIDIFDKNNYDLIIDTTNMKPEEIVDKILTAIKVNP